MCATCLSTLHTQFSQDAVANEVLTDLLGALGVEAEAVLPALPGYPDSICATLRLYGDAARVGVGSGYRYVLSEVRKIRTITLGMSEAKQSNRNNKVSAHPVLPHSLAATASHTTDHHVTVEVVPEQSTKPLASVPNRHHISYSMSPYVANQRLGSHRAKLPKRHHHITFADAGCCDWAIWLNRGNPRTERV